MIKQEHPPTQAESIQSILNKLNIKAVDQILQSDSINVDFLAKTTNLHKNIVIKLLFELHQLVNKPEEIVKSDRYSLSMKQVIREWANELITHPQIDKLKDALVGSSDIIEIIGRANSGKSYFCFAFILNCLQRGLYVIFLDSNQNFQALKAYIKRKVGDKPENAHQLFQRIIYFKFRTLSQFTILLHNLGNQLILQKKQENSLIEKGVITFIDCLSRIQMADPDTDEQNSTMDFDIIEKLKRLIVTFSTRVSTIVYTNRIPTAYTLFQTFYKNQKHRPRCKNNNAKLWDSLATKTIIVEYSKTMRNHEIKRIHLSKDISNDVITFEK